MGKAVRGISMYPTGPDHLQDRNNLYCQRTLVNFVPGGKRVSTISQAVTASTKNSPTRRVLELLMNPAKNLLRELLVLLAFTQPILLHAGSGGPTISNLNPNTGAVGAQVIINGSGFGNSQGSSTVTFNGIEAAVAAWAAGGANVTVPAGATTGNVVVTVNGKASNGVLFTVVPAPVLSSLSPQSGPVGTAVTLTGSNFGSTTGQVYFNPASTAATINRWSPTSIMAVVPQGSTTGGAFVYASGVFSDSLNFTVSASLSSISPVIGPIGSTVTIAGQNLGSTQNGSSVTFNGVPATITSWNSTSITAVVPSGVPAGNVTVAATVAGNSTNTLLFLVGTITSPIYHLDQGTGSSGKNLLTTGTPNSTSMFLQTADLKGSAQNGVALIGTFTTLNGIVGTIPAGSTVTFSLWMKETASVSGIFPYAVLQGPPGGTLGVCAQNGATALTTTLTNYQITCNIPSNLTVTSAEPFWLYVQVNWPNNSISKSVQAQLYFDGTPKGNYDSSMTVPEVIYPFISGISSSTGSPGSSLTINGWSFGTTQGTSTVSIGGTIASATSWSDTQIAATVPCASGPLGVTVNGNPSNSLNFSAAVAAPVISSATAASIGSSTTVTGSNFIQSPCNTSVTFSGLASTPTGITANQITTAVPSGAISGGPLVVSIGSISSVPMPFTVSGAISGAVTQAGNGAAISGASVQALQSNNVVASTTTAANGSYTISNLSAGTFDVRFSASGYGTAIASGNSVLYGASTVVNASLAPPGTISGQVTQSDGKTAIPGANVAAASSSSAAGSATTDSNGNYTISTLAPGSYTTVASATGFVTQTSGSVSVTSSNTTTQNFSLLNASAQSAISYFYDELGRLIGASDSQGNTATYSYDAVGNLLSIAVNPSSQVSIIGFDPVHGAAGTSVTINGTGFSSTASQNTVTFNGTTATVTSASSTQLAVTVPTGAATGPIKVVAPGGSSTSSSSFTIP